MSAASRSSEVPHSDTYAKSKALNSAAVRLSSRIHAGVEESRDKLRLLNRAVDNAKGVGETEYFLHVYLALKSDTREMLTLFREVVLSKNNLSRDKDQELRNLEKDLIAFEKNFEETGFRSTEQQIGALLKLVEAKEQAVFRLCNELNANAAGEVGNESPLENEESVACSKGTHELLNTCRIFRSLDKAVKTVAMGQESKNLALNLMSKQLEVNELTAQLSERDLELNRLAEQLHTLSTTSNRQQIIARQNEINLALESRVKDLEKMVADLTSENGVLARQKAMAVDSVASLRSQLRDARVSYEEIVKKLQPVVEQQVTQNLADKREIDSIRSDVGAGLARFSVAEERIRAQEVEIITLKETVRKLEGENEAWEKRMQEQEVQTSKQNRINLVLVAAKLKYENLSKELDASLKNLENVRLVEQHACSLHLNEMQRMGEYIEELRAEVQRLLNQLEEADVKIKYHIADSRSMELMLDKLQTEMAEIQEIGYTPEKKAEYELMRAQFDEAYVKMDRMQKQLAASVYKQQELQAEIYELQSRAGITPSAAKK